MAPAFGSLRRSLRVLRVQVRAAVLLSLQYRLEFAVDTAMAVAWTATALAPLAILFRMRDGVAGWSWPEALVVVGFFTILKGALVGVIQPALNNVVEHVRKGTLDFLLLKPVDAQLLLSTSKLDLPRVADLVSGTGLIVFGVVRSGRAVPLTGIAEAVLLLGGGALMLYSIWVIAVSMAFHFVKVDNLSYLIVSTFDAARWPSSVFTGALSFLFTFILPLGLMTTYPALAILGRLGPSRVALALAVAAAFLVVSRAVWTRSIRHYTSAGG